MAGDILEIEGLTLHYGGSQILHGVDITAARGEVTCVMGTNGVGKTSLLKAISGTHPRSGGCYRLDGEEIGAANAPFTPLGESCVAAKLQQVQELGAGFKVIEVVELGGQRAFSNQE